MTFLVWMSHGALDTILQRTWLLTITFNVKATARLCGNCVALRNATSCPKGKVGNVHNQTCGYLDQVPGFRDRNHLALSPRLPTVPEKRTAPGQRPGGRRRAWWRGQSPAEGPSAILRAACLPGNKSRVHHGGLRDLSQRAGCSSETTLSPFSSPKVRSRRGRSGT